MITHRYVIAALEVARGDQGRRALLTLTPEHAGMFQGDRLYLHLDHPEAAGVEAAWDAYCDGFAPQPVLIVTAALDAAPPPSEKPKKGSRA